MSDEITPLELLPRQARLALDLPYQPELTKKVREFIRTGERAAKDHEKVERVMRLVLSRASLNRISQACHVDKRTVREIVEIAEQAGIVPPLKQRMLAGALEVMELAQEELMSALETGALPANVRPMCYGVAVDKVLMLTGAGGEETGPKEGGPDPVAEWLERFRAAKPAQVEPPLGAASDATSAADPAKPAEIAGFGGEDTPLDTVPPATGTAGPPGETRGGGGGARRAGGGENREGLDFGDCTTKRTS